MPPAFCSPRIRLPFVLQNMMVKRVPHRQPPVPAMAIILNESYCSANPRNSLRREIWVFL